MISMLPDMVQSGHPLFLSLSLVLSFSPHEHQNTYKVDMWTETPTNYANTYTSHDWSVSLQHGDQSIWEITCIE